MADTCFCCGRARPLPITLTFDLEELAKAQVGHRCPEGTGNVFRLCLTCLAPLWAIADAVAAARIEMVRERGEILTRWTEDLITGRADVGQAREAPLCRALYHHAGAHVAVRLFVGPEGQGALAGELTFRAAEWDRVATQMRAGGWTVQPA